LFGGFFYVYWSSHRNQIISRFTAQEKTFLRRKLSLDQIAPDQGKNIFEHEELGRTLPLKVRPGKERKKITAFLDVHQSRIDGVTDGWVLPRKRFFPDPRIRASPLYASWDQRSLVLCNRFLPLNYAIRTTIRNSWTTHVKVNPSMFLRNLEGYSRTNIRKECKAWPKNFKTRRIRLRNVRYTRRAILKSRAFPGERFLLSQDRSSWRRISTQWDAAVFAPWLNPRSDRQLEASARTGLPVRGSQSFPLALERGILPRTYVPGNIQPSVRGGFVWPGTHFSSFVKKIVVVVLVLVVVAVELDLLIW
jgi:hypothetical protein